MMTNGKVIEYEWHSFAPLPFKIAYPCIIAALFAYSSLVAALGHLKLVLRRYRTHNVTIRQLKSEVAYPFISFL